MTYLSIFMEKLAFYIKKSIRLIGIILLIIFLSNNAYAFPNSNESYQFITKNQPVIEVLKLFSKNIGIALHIDSDISGKVGNNFPTGLNREEYISRLAREFNFIWFYYGGKIYIDSATKAETELFALRNNDGAQIITSLINLQLFQPKFYHAVDRRNRVLLVSGSPSYIALIKKAVIAIEKADINKIIIIRGSRKQSSSTDITTNQLSEISTPE